MIFNTKKLNKNPDEIRRLDTQFMHLRRPLRTLLPNKPFFRNVYGFSHYGPVQRAVERRKPVAGEFSPKMATRCRSLPFKGPKKSWPPLKVSIFMDNPFEMAFVLAFHARERLSPAQYL